jgi:hypothetical protein
MELQYNRQQGRDSAASQNAEGANLGQAKPGETLRQKDPVPDSLWKTPLMGYRRCNAWLVETRDANLSGQITEARDQLRAPFAFTQYRSNNETFKLMISLCNHFRRSIIWDER